MVADLNINRKQFDTGDIVYFIRKDSFRWYVSFGTVEEQYTSEICIQLYEFPDNRRINGIPVNDFRTPTEWKKLPKGWTYNTELFEMAWDTRPKELIDLRINRKADLLKAIRLGFLVKVQNIDHCTFEAEIDGKNGWRIVRKYPSTVRANLSYISVDFHDAYSTYEDANEVIEKRDAELRMQAEMSDYDWSVMQIDETLSRWAALYSKPDEEKEKYRAWLLQLDDIEDVVTRCSVEGLQWKYEKGKKWMTIVL